MSKKWIDLAHTEISNNLHQEKFDHNTIYLIGNSFYAKLRDEKLPYQVCDYTKNILDLSFIHFLDSYLVIYNKKRGKIGVAGSIYNNLVKLKGKQTKTGYILYSKDNKIEIKIEDYVEIIQDGITNLRKSKCKIYIKYLDHIGLNQSVEGSIVRYIEYKFS